MTWAGYPQIVLAARSPRSIFPGNRSCRAKIFASKTIRIQRAARDMNSIMADPYPIRPITVDEYVGFRRVHEHAFNSGPVSAPRWARTRRLFEPDRSLAAFDAARPAGEAQVGTTGVYSLRMTVPGGALPAAGVSAVSVLPSHRRRGVLRSLMRRQLADLAARGGEPIAVLWASETPIYARYGYGRASSNAYFRFERGDGALAATAPADPAVTLRLAEPQAVTAALAQVYDTVRPVQPGFFARSGDWWGRVLADEPDERHGFSPLRCLLAEDGAGARGYALYATAERWDEPTGLPDCRLVVRELIAADPAAGAALWHNLLTRDLVSAVTAEYRSADDPLLYQLLDQRRARAQVFDGLWVRVIDLPGALTGRAYCCPVDVVLEVGDELLAGNAGRWRLRASGPGADVSCVRTDEPADLALDVRELGAAYLGGTRLGTLAAAGLVRELRPGTLNRLSAAMTWDPAPWCPQLF
jgi:predicted acetyltransferase